MTNSVAIVKKQYIYSGEQCLYRAQNRFFHRAEAIPDPPPLGAVYNYVPVHGWKTRGAVYNSPWPSMQRKLLRILCKSSSHASDVIVDPRYPCPPSRFSCRCIHARQQKTSPPSRAGPGCPGRGTWVRVGLRVHGVHVVSSVVRGGSVGGVRLI
jgi:hypothetical protein